MTHVATVQHWDGNTLHLYAVCRTVSAGVRYIRDMYPDVTLGPPEPSVDDGLARPYRWPVTNTRGSLWEITWEPIRGVTHVHP